MKLALIVNILDIDDHFVNTGICNLDDVCVDYDAIIISNALLQGDIWFYCANFRNRFFR